MEYMKTKSFTLTKELIERIDKKGLEEERSASSIVRRALKRYFGA